MNIKIENQQSSYHVWVKVFWRWRSSEGHRKIKVRVYVTKRVTSHMGYCYWTFTKCVFSVEKIPWGAASL